jgi:uncharacterized protein involved in exopolysaccharide biosynthesis
MRQSAQKTWRKTAGREFRIVDYAKAPRFGEPNAMRIAMIFLAMGFGTGAGILFLFEICFHGDGG